MDYKLDNLEKAAKLEKSGDWQQMLMFCREWAAAEPGNHLAWQGIGDSLAQLGRVVDAISTYRTGLGVAPASPVDFFGTRLSASSLWYRLGNAYTALGDSAKAIDAFNEAARIEPEVAEIWNNLGIAYVNANNPQEAGEAFKRGAAVDPSNTTILTNLGLLYARCGVEQGVASVFRLLIKADERAAIAYLKNAKQILSSR